MKLVFDLDGTLYNTFPLSFSLHQDLRMNFGYGPISPELFLEKFQSNDWGGFYRSLGILEKDIGKVINYFLAAWKNSPQPSIIPGAREAIKTAEQTLGEENIYILTNETTERVKSRFLRDGLERLLPQTYNSFEGKSEEICRLAGKDKLVYIGDLVSDGEECIKARAMGADAFFWGILHIYSMNTREAMEHFASKHLDFASTIESLSEIGSLLKQ